MLERHVGILESAGLHRRPGKGVFGAFDGGRKLVQRSNDGGEMRDEAMVEINHAEKALEINLDHWLNHIQNSPDLLATTGELFSYPAMLCTAVGWLYMQHFTPSGSDT